jgi:HK97 family phage prohead protease
MHRTKSAPAYFKAADDGSGTFEAIVAVFGNVDHQGDRIVPGAFANTLEEWKASGDPIPVIHSHQWHDLDAHIGVVDPKDATELNPGDERLPDSLKDLGGLYVKGTIDMDDPSGAKAHRLMARRSLREFSFAYDIREDGEGRGDDGVNELSDLDLFEVGPTLKGANPATVLVGAKSRAEIAEAIAKDYGLDDEMAEAIKAALAETPAKAQVTLGNSIETHLEAIAGEVREWAIDTFGDELYWTYVEATMPDRVLAYVELWDEPLEGGTFYELDYTADGDDIEIGEARAVELQLSTVPKAFATLPRAKATAGEPVTPAPKAEDPEDAKDDEDDVEIPTLSDIRSMIGDELNSLDV